MSLIGTALRRVATSLKHAELRTEAALRPAEISARG